MPARRSANQRTTQASCFPADFPGTRNKGRKAKSSGMLRPSETELLRIGQASFRCTVRATGSLPHPLLLTSGFSVRACANQVPPRPFTSFAERSKNEQIHKSSLETDAKTLTHASTPKHNQASLSFVKRAEPTRCNAIAVRRFSAAPTSGIPHCQL